MPNLLAVLVGLSVAMTPVPPKELTITFIAHAAVHITDGKNSVLVDFPYDPGTTFTPWSIDLIPRGSKALCVVTHSHRDHFDPAMAAQFCGALLGPKDLVATSKVQRVELQPEVQWKDVTINAIATPHDNVEHYSYLLKWHGARIYFTGDAEDLAALSAARDLDAAFVTPSLLSALQRKGDHLDARRIISYHHRPGDPVPKFQDRLASVPGQVWTLSTAGH